MGPPPGLFILGPVPSIIRCWLNTNFSNDSLLYAAVCTGSYKSVISLGMISQLGLQDQIHVTSAGQQSIKLSVYLPEATIQQPSSRSNSPAAQLPTLPVDFAVQNPSSELNGLQIFLGCDVLRARNADIHFSLDRLTLYDDDRNKLSVPLVRPENAALFQNLQTINVGLHGHQVLLPEREQNQPIAKSRTDEKPTASTSEHAVVTPAVTPAPPSSTGNGQTPVESPISSTTKPSVIGQGRKVIEASNINEGSTAARDDTDIKDTESLANGSTPDTPTRSDNGNIWGSWRRDSTQGARPDVLASSANSSSGYQRAGRGRGMKVLKPARLNTTRSSSTTQPSSGFDSTPGRFSDVGKWPSPTTSNENQDPHDRRFSGGAKSPLPTLTGKPSKSNPVGGASAFGWLNAAQQKQPDASAE